MICYVYKIIDVDTGKYYIGKRITASYENYEADPYMGSGIWIRNYSKEYNNLKRLPHKVYKNQLPNNIEKHLIEYCSHDNLSNREEYYIGDKWVCDNLCMNMSPGGIGCVGSENRSYDNTIYEWKHISGEKYVGTKRDFYMKYGLSQTAVYNVANGKNISVKGWYIDEERYSTANKTHNRTDDTLYEWKHKDGRVEIATKHQMETKYNLTKGKASAVANGTQISVNGWYVDDEKYNKRKTKPYDDTIYDWYKVNGKCETMTRRGLVEKYCLDTSAINNVIKGKRKSHKGWILNKNV